MQNCDYLKVSNIALWHHLVSYYLSLTPTYYLSLSINFVTKAVFQDTKFCKKCKISGAWVKLKESFFFSGKTGQEITDKIMNSSEISCFMECFITDFAIF